jgi:hypothetical protein
MIDPPSDLDHGIRIEISEERQCVIEGEYSSSSDRDGDFLDTELQAVNVFDEPDEISEGNGESEDESDGW